MTPAAAPQRPRRRLLQIPDRAVLVAFGCILLLLAIGGLTSRSFLTPVFLSQQLQRAAYLGVIALGQFTVILVGRIDLSMPWTLTTAAILATAAASGGGAPWLALPVGLLVGLAIGLVNGLGIGYLRVPSMIFTLGINSVLLGLMTLFTGGGFAPGDNATGFMSWLGVGRTLGVPNPILVWAVVAAIFSFVLRRTVLGRSVYALGNAESAAYLSGINTRKVVLGTFLISGLCAGLAGILLAGYAGKAAQAMGDEFLLPSIAAVVLGGTNVLGGRGTVLGTVAGVLLVTLLGGMLTVTQLPEAGRLIIYSVAIVGMLLIYGRDKQRRI